MKTKSNYSPQNFSAVNQVRIFSPSGAYLINRAICTLLCKLVRGICSATPSCDTKRLFDLSVSRRDKHSESKYAATQELQELVAFAEDALCEQNDFSREAHACVVYEEEVLNRKRDKRKALENTGKGSPLVAEIWTRTKA